MPEPRDAGELEGTGETIYQGDLKDVLFVADYEGAKTFWRRTVVHERDCKVCEGSCTSEMQSRDRSRSGREEPGAGDPASLRIPEGSRASAQMNRQRNEGFLLEKEVVGLNPAS